MTALPITESQIRAGATADSFRRGQEYVADEAVERLILRGSILHAEVLGSEEDPYQITIAFDAQGVTAATCTCPYEWGGWCKHIVAALLTAIAEPDRIVERPAIATLLADLDRDRLVELVVQLTAASPGLIAAVEHAIPALKRGTAAAARSTKSAVATPDSTPLPPADPAAIRQEVRSIFAGLRRMRPSDAYWHSGSVVGEIDDALNRVRERLAANDGDGALAVLDAVTDEYARTWPELDDSNGEYGDFFATLGRLWTEAILTADLAADDRAALNDKLETLDGDLADYGIEETFDAALAALEQSWEFPPLKRVLAGDASATEEWRDQRHWFSDELAVARLNVLERRGQFQEFLNLARAEGQLTRYAIALVGLDRTEEAVAFGLQSFTAANEVLSLARALHDHGATGGAVTIAAHGLPLEPPRAPLAAWLAERASATGNTALAIDALTVELKESPSLAIYLRLKDLSGDDWPARQTDLIAHLRRPSGYSARGHVEIFLHEGLIDDAIAKVDDSYSDDLVMLVVDAATSTHPDWVIRTAHRFADPIMNEGRAAKYHEAADWLRKAGLAYRAKGDLKPWHAELDILIDRHHRKYKLRPLLEALRR